MKTAILFLFSLMLLGCGIEGLEMEIEDVDEWFQEHQSTITSIVESFKNDKCLKRVELGSMKFIDQNCRPNNSQELEIKKIQAELLELGVVLATSHFFDDGNFVAGVLINRRGIAVSGGGIKIVYWEFFPESLNAKLECGAIIPLTRDKWYAEILSSGDACL